MKISAFSKTYEGRTVLDFPGADLQPGKLYAVIGANGSGKSTFAKILSGILPADKRGIQHSPERQGRIPGGAADENHPDPPSGE